MNERAAFLAALAANEDDVTTRMVYADWLDDRGEHEEADRQRKWPAAKEWLVQFARRFDPGGERESWYPGRYQEVVDTRYFPLTYGILVEMGHDALSCGAMDCGAHEDLCETLRSGATDFWRNWSIVTGVHVPVAVSVAEMRYGCSC